MLKGKIRIWILFHEDNFRLKSGKLIRVGKGHRPIIIDAACVIALTRYCRAYNAYRAIRLDYEFSAIT
jgi:hypothetical protein